MPVQNIDRTIDDISEADPAQLALIFEAAVARLGQHGRDAREAIQLKLSDSSDDDVPEGIEQLVDVVDGICRP